MNELMQIQWEDFHFLRPALLWLFVPAFVALALGLIGLREEVKWKNVIAPHLRPYIIKKGSEKLKKNMQLALLIFLSIAILGLSGPTWRTIEVPGKTLETPVVVLLELSESMKSTDLQPSRLERAKFKINDLLDANPRARFALIAFSGTAHTVVPLSSDYKIIRSHLEALSPQIMPFPGANLEAALQLADTLTKVSSAPGTLILFADDFDEESFDLLQNYSLQGDKKIEIFPMNTTVDPALRSKLNSVDGITVHQLTLDKSDVESLAETIAENLEFQEEEEQKEDDWLDRGLWLAIPFGFLILFSFRRGGLIFSFLIMAMLYSCDGNSTFKDLWLTKDFQAQKAYDNGDFEQAAGLFTDPLRKGISLYKAGDYNGAIQYFSLDTTEMGAYNLGLAQQILSGMDEADPEQIEEAPAEETAQNIKNTDPEDLGGGGQEASEEDMEKERKEETAATDMRKGKELDEVPEDFESGRQDESQKVLMRRVDDDPALFLKRKFAHQVKVKNMKPKSDKK